MATQVLRHFTPGKKEIFLPNFTLTLLRTPNRPAHEAKFIVPLWFSKLDLRDYLHHAYSLRTLSIRSYVKQSRIREGDPEISLPQIHRWHRPRSTKVMTVEMERPFVWPELPEDYSNWNKQQMEESEKMSEDVSDREGYKADTWVNEERRERMGEQARELLEGRRRWKGRWEGPMGRGSAVLVGRREE